MSEIYFFLASWRSFVYHLSESLPARSILAPQMMDLKSAWYLIFALINLVWLSTYLGLIGKVLKTILFWPEQLDFVFLVLAPSLMQVTPCSVSFQISN
jgi:hypothetical protein